MTSYSSPEPCICPNCEGAKVSLVSIVHVTRESIPAKLCYCSDCDFLFLADPTWLDKAYSVDFLGDTGYASRNINIASKLQLLFRIYTIVTYKSIGRACDYGTGVGLLPRLMRDMGYDFYGFDPYAKTVLKHS